MSLKFISARFGAADRHCVVAVTEQCGAMVISADDNPKEWLSLWESGVIIEPFLQMGAE